MTVSFAETGVLTLATLNIGNARYLPELFADAIGFQEAGDQYGKGDIIAQARADGYNVISGDEPGQSSTPLVYNPRTLRLLKVRRYLLADRQFVGPGAGPSWLKWKWAVGGKFEHVATGRRFWVFADHYVASQQKWRRMRVALAMTNRLVLLGKQLARPVFNLADANAIPGSRALRALRRAGWLMNHLVGRMRGTHGRRAIDQIWWQPRRWIKFLRHWTVATGSDHDAVVAEFAITPRKKARR